MLQTREGQTHEGEGPRVVEAGGSLSGTINRNIRVMRRLCICMFHASRNRAFLRVTAHLGSCRDSRGESRGLLQSRGRQHGGRRTDWRLLDATTGLHCRVLNKWNLGQSRRGACGPDWVLTREVGARYRAPGTRNSSRSMVSVEAFAVARGGISDTRAGPALVSFRASGQR